MKKHAPMPGGWGSAVMAAACILAPSGSPARAESAADRFAAAVGADLSLPQEVRELVSTSWANCRGCDGAEFLTQGIAVLSEGFRIALDAYEAEEYQRCAVEMGRLCAEADPFLAVNAAAYQIKALVAQDRLIEAGERIAALDEQGAGRVDRYSYFAPEIAFLRGYCLLGDLQYEAAAQALKQFLRDHEEAPDRLLLPAAQMLSELANRVPGGIGEVADLMGFSHRRLKTGATDEGVVERQQRIVELLDGLIEEAESLEQSSSSSGSGGAGGAQGGMPSNPMSESRLPDGTPSGTDLRESRRANPGEVWGAMPPAQRDAVLQALRESFPARYRQLVEQYYEELARKP